jgi:hypothetical protein
MLHVSSTGDHFVVNGVIWPKYIIEVGKGFASSMDAIAAFLS